MVAKARQTKHYLLPEREGRKESGKEKRQNRNLLNRGKRVCVEHEMLFMLNCCLKPGRH